VLGEVLESAEDDSNLAALTRILKHLDTRPLTTLGSGGENARGNSGFGGEPAMPRG
jgi:hypothetical protein